MRVWDLPTRAFHWLIAVLVFVSWGAAEWHNMELHYLSGLTILGLLAFRLLWGLFGSSTARFASFVRGPAALRAHLSGSGEGGRAGHNPLGALSVLALLALLAIQTGTGLFATDTDGLESGPLSFLVSYDTADLLTEVHEIAFNLLLAMIALHVAAIAWYLLVKRRNLVRPMVTGRDPQVTSGEMQPAGVVRFVIAAMLAAGFAWAASKGFFL